MAVVNNFYKLSISPGGPPTIVNLNQYENGRKLIFELINGGNKVELPEGSSCFIAGTKPDGNIYSGEGTVNSENKTVVFQEEVQMTAVAGRYEAKIKIINNGYTVATGIINIYVREDVVDPEAERSDSVIQGLIAEARQYSEAAQRAVEEVEDAGEQALKAEGYAVGTQHGVDVSSGSEYYHNNSKWYSEQAGESANTASTKAREASESSGTASTKANEASQSASDADQAKRDAVAAKDRAEEVAGSLPADYTQMSEDVAELKEKIETKANIDGNYKDLNAGSADQLVSTQYHEDQEPYLYRTSGGSTDIGDLENDTIVGGSVVWNQYCGETASFADWQKNRVSVAKDGNTTTVTSTSSSAGLKNIRKVFPQNHKLYVRMRNIVATKENEGMAYYGIYNGLTDSTYLLRVTIGGEYATDVDRIITTGSSYTNPAFAIGFGTANQIGDKVDIEDLQLIDLTTMFGSTIADYVYSLEQTTEGSGIAWLKKYGFFTKDYYEYCEPTMRSVEGLVSHDMVGFNLWDEEWEVGDILNGEPRVITNAIRSKNFTRCVPNTQYHLYCGSKTATSQYAVRVVFYDQDKNYISVSAWCANLDFTTPSNCGYFKITTQNTGNALSTYGGTYNNDICVNLSWSGTRNGEYEPYEKASYPLDSTLTLRGIPKLDSQNQLYYDGDTYEPDGTVTRRFGTVDLGTLTWKIDSSVSAGSLWYAAVGDAKGSYATYGNTQICSKYAQYSQSGTQPSDWKSGECRFGSNSKNINVCDDALIGLTATQVKAAMSGVYLVYELATETTEAANPFVDPQRVNDWGTEEYVCQSDSDFIVPVGHDTKYRVNLRDKLQHMPDMADDDGYYLIQQIGSKMSLVNFRIPQAPATDGTYILKAIVSGGVPSYIWEGVVETTATEVIDA